MVILARRSLLRCPLVIANRYGTISNRASTAIVHVDFIRRIFRRLGNTYIFVRPTALCIPSRSIENISAIACKRYNIAKLNILYETRDGPPM